MFKMNYTIPALEAGWGIFTLLQYRANGFSELMAYRFFVGIFEVSDKAQKLKKIPNNSFRQLFSQGCTTSLVLGTEVTSLVDEEESSMLVRCWVR